MSGSDPAKTLLLVDGSSYLYRAFHALPELRSPKTGEPTGAIYGVLNMLRKLATDYKPAALACVFDAKGKTFRDAVYPSTRRTARRCPTICASQVEPLHEAVAALGWPLLVIDGVEADDVIATLAEQAKRDGWRTVISTGDKDFAQLVDERVTLVNTMSNEMLDVAGVKKKFGVPPEKIPRLPHAHRRRDRQHSRASTRSGPKTAGKWIEQYGSLEGVLAHADEISGLARREPAQGRATGCRRRAQLLTIKRDVPLPLKIDDLHAEARSRRSSARNTSASVSSPG